MIKKRNQANNIQVKQEAETPKKGFPFLVETETFLEQSIKVLNILESQGINIYDPNRTPGMYLKNKKSNISDIFKQEKIQNSEIIDNPVIDKKSLNNFFKNK